MFVRIGKMFVIVTLVATTGAHWALLQSVAWTTMLADNLRTQSVTEAVTQTFDGDHPCSLCQAIAAGKKSEHKTEISSPSLKLEFPPLSAKIVLIAPRYFQIFPSANFFAESLPQKPPLPPPRNFFV
jgi:hypothetical protein